VSSDSILNGTVNVSLVNGFTPTVGDTFDILLTEALSGEFSSVVAVNGGLQWSMRYIIDETGQDIARLTALPIPAAGWLMLSGLAVFAGIRRGRILWGRLILFSTPPLPRPLSRKGRGEYKLRHGFQ
jgi:hypothetical protein